MTIYRCRAQLKGVTRSGSFRGARVTGRLELPSDYSVQGPRMQLSENTVVADRFKLSRMIGRGGMGSVRQATDLRLSTVCAVKSTEGEMANMAAAHARFQREAQAAAKLRSPHVVQIFDHGVWQGLPSGVVNAVVQQVCRALSKAHAAGVVHRDLCYTSPEQAQGITSPQYAAVGAGHPSGPGTYNGIEPSATAPKKGALIALILPGLPGLLGLALAIAIVGVGVGLGGAALLKGRSHAAGEVAAHSDPSASAAAKASEPAAREAARETAATANATATATATPPVAAPAASKEKPINLGF